MKNGNFTNFILLLTNPLFTTRTWEIVYCLMIASLWCGKIRLNQYYEHFAMDPTLITLLFAFDSACLQYCFMDLLRQDLKRIAFYWNTHRIRPYPMQETPSGRPEVLFNLPELEGGIYLNFCNIAMPKSNFISLFVHRSSWLQGWCCFWRHRNCRSKFLWTRYSLWM